MKRLLIFLLLTSPCLAAHDFSGAYLHPIIPEAKEILAPDPQVNTFCASNLTCTITAAWTYTSALNVATVNNKFFVCNTSASYQYQTVAAALTALGSSNGSIEVCSGHGIATADTFTTTQVIGSATQRVDIFMNAPSVWSCNVTVAANDCWHIGKGGQIRGPGMLTANTNCTTAACLQVLSTASITFGVTNTDKSGAQEYFFLQGVAVFAQNGATFAAGGALVDADGVFDGSIISDNLIYNANAAGLKLQASAGTSGQFPIFHNFINGGGQTNAIPLVVLGGASKYPQNIWVHDGSIVNSGASQPLVQINGNGTSGCQQITLDHLYLEVDQTPPTSPVTVQDCHGVKIDDVQVFSIAAGSTQGVAISESASGLTYDVNVTNFFFNQGGPVSTISGNGIPATQLWAGGIFGIDYHFGSPGNTTKGGRFVRESDLGTVDWGTLGSGNAFVVSANRGFQTGTIYTTNPAFVFTMDHVNGPNIQAYSSGGALLGTSWSINKTTGLLQTNLGVTPATAGAVDIGTTALPYGNLWLGTAATNNFKFQPASTTAARVITMADPLQATVALPMTIANGTKALNTAAITTATCDAGLAATATGTLSTDTVDWSFNSAPTTANKYGAFLVVYAVPSTNTVTFYTCNPSATTSTPTAMTVNFSVRRP